MRREESKERRKVEGVRREERRERQLDAGVRRLGNEARWARQDMEDVWTPT